MKNKIKIPLSVWETFERAVNDNPAIKFIGWEPSDSKATVYLDSSGGEEAVKQVAVMQDLPANENIREWATAVLEPYNNIKTLETVPAPQVSTPQPGDSADGATLGAFLRLKKDKSIIFVTANHADEDGVIYVGNGGHKASVKCRNPDLDILIAGFDPPTRVNPTIKYTKIIPKSIASSWPEGQRFGLIGAMSGKVAFASAYEDKFILSKEGILNGNYKPDEGGVIVELDKFELILEPSHTIRNGDSGGPVLFAQKSKDECENKIAGIMIEITSIDNNRIVIAAKMSAIATRFGVKLY